ncbi:MAG: T9SS type A sorting domain-containing protein, partial [Chitinophagales bacterium]
TPAEYSTPEEDVSNIRKNMFELFKYCSPVDIGVVDLISPPDGCGLDSTETIIIEVENFGPTAVSSFPVKYTLDGGPVVNEIATIIAATGSTATYTFDATGNFAAIGLHTLIVYTDVYVDEDHTNDTLTFYINTLEAPVVDLGNDTTVCDLLTLDAENPGMYYLWSSGETTQIIDVEEPGVYIAYVTHPVTGCVKSDTISVDLVYTPDASFTYTITGTTVSFTNTSTTGAIYTWYFGDGTYTNENSPSHTFTDGAFTVALVAENNCGDDYYYVVFSFEDGELTSINNPDLSNLTLLYPNPTNGNTTLDMYFDRYYNVSYEIYNNIGQVVSAEAIGPVMQKRHTLRVADLAEGIYMIKVQADDQTFTKQLVIVK